MAPSTPSDIPGRMVDYLAISFVGKLRDSPSYVLHDASPIGFNFSIVFYGTLHASSASMCPLLLILA